MKKRLNWYLGYLSTDLQMHRLCSYEYSDNEFHWMWKKGSILLQVLSQHGTCQENPLNPVRNLRHDRQFVSRESIARQSECKVGALLWAAWHWRNWVNFIYEVKVAEKYMQGLTPRKCPEQRNVLHILDTINIATKNIVIVFVRIADISVILPFRCILVLPAPRHSSEKACPRFTLSITNPTFPNQCSNPGRRLNYNTAKTFFA